MAGIKAGSAVKYMLLPGLLPRIRELFFSGFSLLAYYIALVYGMAKIIPAGHPYLNQANIGRFGLRDAVFAAWKNLEFKWKNIDKVIFFFALISGLLLMMAYVFGSFFFLVTAPAMAAPQFGELFTNPNPTHDIAFMMLDRMLGIPGVYDSKVVTTTEFGQMPTPFHSGLHALFAYFSWGIFGIAILIILYFVVDIVLEATITGSPFGKHFQNAWVPLRIVAGIGLLIPVSYGLNSAQWITLYVAKMGSNFATNAWIAFNEGMENPLGMSNNELVAMPVSPDYINLAKDLFTIRACKDVDQKLASGKSSNSASPAPSSGNPDEIVIVGTKKKDIIDAYFVDGNRYFTVLGYKDRVGKSWPSEYNSNFINLYIEGLRFYKGKDVRIVFGRFSEEALASGKYPGGVEPTCGEVLIPNLLPAGQEVPPGNIKNSEINQGVLMGASHMYAVLNMVIGISKTGYGLEKNNKEQEYQYRVLELATLRKYYQETSQGQRLQTKHAAKVTQEIAEADANGVEASGDNPNCINDHNNDGYDDDGYGSDAVQYTELGACDGPISNQFYMNLAERYQRYFSYGPLMGYEYYTNKAQDVLNQRCARIDCGNVVSGAKATCTRMLDNCQKTRDGYQPYKPLQSVYYKNLGQDNPFLINRNIDSGLFKYGWGGAGIWYKSIAERNGDLTGAAGTLPRVIHPPRLMQIVSTEKAATQKSTSTGSCERFNPQQIGDKAISLPGNVNDANEMAELYYNLCDSLASNEYMKLPGSAPQKSDNPFNTYINSLFGTKALFDFRENSGVNPMAQFASLGRALLDKAIQNIMWGAGLSAGGGLASAMGSISGDKGMIGGLATITMALGKLLSTFSTLSLVAGVLLYYVIPFLPFLYFFFAVGTWVKTVFEALVGVPLWALAHIRMEGGEGFSGKAASGGYFLLLEIFIRPIVTTMSLVASMFIFMALASLLNTTWGIASNNLVGYDPVTQMSSDAITLANARPAVDQFFFTIMYIVFMYILATTSFKLIDQIPDSIMRWIDGVKAWGVNDNADALVGEISQTVGFPVYQTVTKTVTPAVDLIGSAPGAMVGFKADMDRMAQKMQPNKPDNG